MGKRLWLVGSLAWSAFWVLLLWSFWTGNYPPDPYEFRLELIFVFSPWLIGPVILLAYRFVRYGELRKSPKVEARWVD